MAVTEDRVETLEKQVRRQRRWNLALGALLIAGGSIAATAERSIPDVVQAKKFEVVNADGRVVIRLDSLENAFYESIVGSGSFWLMNGNGVPAAVIGCGTAGGWLTVQGTNPEQTPFMTGLSAATTDNGGTWRGGLFLRNGPRIKNDVVHLTMSPDGNGLIRTYDSKGAVTSSSPASTPVE